MHYKNFDQLFPSLSGSQIIVRHKREKDIIFLSAVEHPHSINPKKYNKDFFKIIMQDEWVDVCGNVKDSFEWLDPCEDLKTPDFVFTPKKVNDEIGQVKSAFENLVSLTDFYKKLEDKK